MGMLQGIYNWLNSLRAPKWLVVILGELQNIIIETMIGIGKEYIKGLSEEILRVSDMDIPGDKKFELVFRYGKMNIPNIKDASLNLAIELLVSLYKKNSFMRIT